MSYITDKFFPTSNYIVAWRPNPTPNWGNVSLDPPHGDDYYVYYEGGGWHTTGYSYNWGLPMSYDTDLFNFNNPNIPTWATDIRVRLTLHAKYRGPATDHKISGSIYTIGSQGMFGARVDISTSYNYYTFEFLINYLTSGYRPFTVADINRTNPGGNGNLIYFGYGAGLDGSYTECTEYVDQCYLEVVYSAPITKPTVQFF